MNFPARGIAIIQALYKASPQDDVARRIDIQRVGEQMAHDLGPNWGNKKRAGLSDDFRSPDSIAYREDDGSVSVWDIQASNGAILVHADKPADHPNLPASEAAFMPCVPTNHLGGEPLPGEVPPLGSPAPSADLGLVLAEIESVRARLDGIELQIAGIAALVAKPQPSVTFPVYKGAIGLPGWIGGNRPIELKPEGQ